MALSLVKPLSIIWNFAYLGMKYIKTIINKYKWSSTTVNIQMKNEVLFFNKKKKYQFEWNNLYTKDRSGWIAMQFILVYWMI